MHAPWSAHLVFLLFVIMLWEFSLWRLVLTKSANTVNIVFVIFCNQTKLSLDFFLHVIYYNPFLFFKSDLVFPFQVIDFVNAACFPRSQKITGSTYADTISPVSILIQDNARCHIVRSVRECNDMVSEKPRP